jgi:hypothetical protein
MIMGNYFPLGHVRSHVMATNSPLRSAVEERPECTSTESDTPGVDHPTVVPTNFDPEEPGQRRRD